MKFSTTDIARQLKLSVAQVEALEAGHFDRLPGPVFVRGFIRNYARLVKLDPDELLRAAGGSLPRQVPRPETPPSQDIPFPSARRTWWRKYAWTAAVLIAALAFYEFFVSGDETIVTTHPIEVAPAPVAVVPDKPDVQEVPAKVVPPPQAGKMPAAPRAAAAVEPAAKEEMPAPPPVAAVPVPAPEPIAVVRAPEPSEKPPLAAAVPATKIDVAPPAPSPGERQVTLVFEDESWVEIRDRDGKLILWQLNPAGTRQVVNGLPPLSFVIGNAHGVQLTYDDRPVNLEPYTKTDVARMTLE